MLQVLLTGAVLGISIAAPPGPITVLSSQQVVSRSWLAGWLVMLGATAADAVFFVLTYYGVARLVTPIETRVLFVVGGALMLYLAFLTFSRARISPGDTSPSSYASLRAAAASTSGSTRGRRRSSGSPFLLGLSMGLTNPYQLGWWVAIGAGMVSQLGASVALGFFAGILAWTLFFTSLVHTGVRRYERLAPIIAYSSAALMVGFGVWFLFAGLSTNAIL